MALFLEGDALDALVTSCGSYVAVGVGVALVLYMLGYVVWFVIDIVRGVL